MENWRKKNNRKYYTCDSNLGVITFHEEPFTGLQELEKYKTPEEYLKTGNTIQYIINFDTYDLQVQVDESLTVSHISLAYDPDRTTTSSDQRCCHVCHERKADDSLPT